MRFDIRAAGGAFLAVLFVLVVVLDAGSLINKRLGVAGVGAWFVVWLVLAAYAILSLARLVPTNPRRLGSLATLAAVALVFASVAFRINDPRLLHHETTQEVGCALSKLESSPSHGYTETCLFGYPARQHFVPALPSLLCGRSQSALHLGTLAYLLFALAIFASGLGAHLSERQDGWLVAALGVVLVTSFYFFQHFMLGFEQSIFPMLFTMMGVGVVLSFERRPSTPLLWLAGLLLLVHAHAYTPALATVVLGLVWLVDIARRRELPPQLRRGALVCLAGTLVSLATSVLYRGENTVDLSRTLGELGQDFRYMAHHLFVGQATPEVFVTPLFLGALVLAVVLLASGAAGTRYVIIAGWVVGVFVAAMVLRGYAWYSVEFRLHRAMVAVPLLLVLAGEAWRRWVPETRQVRLLLAGLLVASALSGFLLQHSVVTGRGGSRSASFVDWWRALPKVQDAAAGELLLVPVRDELSLINLRDFLMYFDPTVRFGVGNGESECAHHRQRFVDQGLDRPVWVLAATVDEAEQCLGLSVHGEVAVFSFEGDTPLVLFEMRRPERP